MRAKAVVLLSLGALAGAAAPAPARDDAAVATGDSGATTCTFHASRPLISFHGSIFRGRTECSVSVQQYGLARASNGDAGTTCSGFRAACQSVGETGFEAYDVLYDVKVIAPLGQGWVAAPRECSGVGTDNLTCTIVADPGWL